MQYSNKDNIQTLRNAIKVTLTLLTLLAIIAVLGDFPILRYGLPVIVGVWLILLAVAAAGGADEIYINVGHGYVEVLRRKLITIKGHRKPVISTKEENLIKVKYSKFMWFRYARINYHGHDGREKATSMGLTMIEQSKRRELIDQLRTICKNNKAR